MIKVKVTSFYDTIPERKTADNCSHSKKKDLTQGLGEVRHFFCPECKTHWYKDKVWTKEEWNNYINEIE